MPLPTSIWLVRRLTVLSGLTRIQESTWAGVGQAARRHARGRARPAGRRSAGEAEPDDQGAAALEERRAGELPLAGDSVIVYAPAFAITAAAFWIAVRIRGYVPQRHRCPFIAVRICASVGRFVVASRSAAWIIIPFWQ